MTLQLKIRKIFLDLKRKMNQLKAEELKILGTFFSMKKIIADQ